MLVDLSGQIERITYTDEESGFTIAKVNVYGQKDVVTVVGNLMSPAPGEILNMRGTWVNHPKFGKQFSVVDFRTSVPATVYGIKKYLGSGLIKGLGPVMADRIVKTFGTHTLDVIENEIDKLTQVEGIGKKRIALIQNAWENQKEIREVMLFFKEESCGKCTPCREGNWVIHEILDRMSRGSGRKNDIQSLKDVSTAMIDTAFCGLGFTAPTSLLDSLDLFEDEFRAAVVK